jgi:hypothetical protein
MKLYCVGIATQGVQESKVVSADDEMHAIRVAYPESAPGTKHVVWNLGNFPAGWVVGAGGQLHATEKGLD